MAPAVDSQVDHALLMLIVTVRSLR
jgi:hypothetical protein